MFASACARAHERGLGFALRLRDLGLRERGLLLQLVLGLQRLLLRGHFLLQLRLDRFGQVAGAEIHLVEQEAHLEHVYQPAVGSRNYRAARCIGCRTFLELCYCSEIPTLALRTKIVIVMHKFEQFKTTNTGWLAARATGGEVFVRGTEQAPPLGLVNATVLYPSEHAVELTPSSGFTTLVIPDGTWSQVRPRRNPCLGFLR